MKPKEKTFSIGRARDCDVVLADDSVSRCHAELTLLKDGKLLLTDCNSSNGTYIIHSGREKKIHQELVSPIDMVQFGDVKISVKELLESIRLKLPSFNAAVTNEIVSPGEPLPQPKKPWVKGKRLVRCQCGAVKVKGKPCRECGK